MPEQKQIKSSRRKKKIEDALLGQSDVLREATPIEFPPTAFRSFSKKKGRLVALAMFVSLLAIGTIFYFQNQSKQVSDEKELEKLVKKVGRIMELPNGIPTVATVTNKNKLDDQPFFKRAENGDKILLYGDGGRAVLYRPSTGKIIDVTTVDIETENAAAQSGKDIAKDRPQTSEGVVLGEKSVSENKEKPTIAIYNGAKDASVVASLENLISQAYPEWNIRRSEKAAYDNYQGVLVIGFSDMANDILKNIAQTVGGTLMPSLPEGEISPDADVLVIVGNQ